MIARSALLAIIAITAVSAHSWLDCANWKLKDPAGYTDVSKQRFADADGTCAGYARRFPIGQKPFGNMDSVQFFRHYVQPVPSNQACRATSGSQSSSGSNEVVGNPRSQAYTPNKDPYGDFTYGTMASVQSGETICWRWPAKNHMAHVNTATNMVFVNWDDTPNRPAGSALSQTAIRAHRVAQMPFANCPVPGKPSPGDSSGVGSDLRPCGGCFRVPDRAPGIYTVQWDWPFKSGDSETYTSCADIQVVASSGNVNCVVGAWSSYSACSSNCGGGTQTRTRVVTTQKSGTGTACPALSESSSCNTSPCTDNLSVHVVYDDEMRGFEDWSWATTYSLTSTSVVHAGTNAISWTPKSWDAVYLHYTTAGADMSAYQSISFYVHGGTTGGQSITFAMVRAGATTSNAIFNWPVPTTSIKANAWTKVELKFASLGYTSGAFDGIWFQAASSATQGALYIDDINFMHVHAGGPPPVVTDPCASVSCGTNGRCVGGSCTCTGGYGKTAAGACTIAPTVSGVTVKTVAGVAVSTLSGDDDEMLAISWSTTGTIGTVSIVLESAASAIPTPIATQITNSGSYQWEVPSSIAAGAYWIRVAYSTTIFARSAQLTKTAAAEPSQCTVPECNGHGECDSDTSFTCLCRYGWTGQFCATAPTNIYRLRGSLSVSTAYSSYTADAAKFKLVFRTDLATALSLDIDQIEVVSVTAKAPGSLVAFDVLLGGSFSQASGLSQSDASLASLLADQLVSPDSSLSQGMLEYSAAGTNATDSSSTGTQSGTQLAGASHSTSSSIVSAVIAAILAMAAAAVAGHA